MRHGWRRREATAPLLMIAILAALAMPRPAYACTCPSKQSVPVALADSHAVFAGRATAVRQPGPQLLFMRRFPFVEYAVPSYAPLHVTLAVSRVWRGQAPRTLQIQTARFYSGCGFPFVEGREYLVYAARNGAGHLITYHCSRTAELRAAADDLMALGPGFRPVSGAAAWAPDARALGAAALVLGLGLFCLGRRRGRPPMDTHRR